MSNVSNESPVFKSYFKIKVGHISLFNTKKHKLSQISNYRFIFGKIKQKPWHNILKCFKKIALQFSLNFPINKKPARLGLSYFKPGSKGTFLVRSHL